MKKFLLLLAALLTASTVHADSYLYVDEIYLTPEQMGTEIVIPVKAHFNAYVSAWVLHSQYPDGMTPVFFERGEDMTMDYYNARGRLSSTTFTLSHSENFCNFVAMSNADGYWHDPNGDDPDAWVSYGQVKWAAGDYDEMILIYVEIDFDFQGGDIVFTTQVGSGYDARGETVEDIGESRYTVEYVCHVNVPIFEPLRGDVNRDHVVNIADASDLIDYLLSHDSSAIDESLADVNNTNSVNIADVSDLIDYLLNRKWYDE